MQLRPLIWEYIGSQECLWRGVADGLLSHASFFITGTTQTNEYLVHTELNGIDQVTCKGLETAKDKAQELLNSYAFSLIIF